MDKTHWKKLTNPNYFGSWDIPEGKSITVEIISVAKELVTGVGGEKEECIVAQLKDQKPLILNKTNCKTIDKVFGSHYIEDWKGKSVVLIIQKIKAFGEVVDAVRVKQVRVANEKPVLSPKSSRWQDAIAAIKSGKCDIDFVVKKFNISAPDLEQLRKETENVK